MIRFALAVAILGLLSVESLANPGPPPKVPVPVAPQPGKEAKFVVVMDRDAKQPRLVVPAAFVGAPARKDGAGSSTVSLNSAFAGLALAGAFVTGGLWIGRRRHNITAALLAVGLLGLGGGMLWADLAVPPRIGAKPVQVKLPSRIQLHDKIRIEVVPNGDTIKLVIPPTDGPWTRGGPRAQPGDKK